MCNPTTEQCKLVNRLKNLIDETHNRYEMEDHIKKIEEMLEYAKNKFKERWYK